MIGIESVVERDEEGSVMRVRGAVVQAHNCGGMFRAWVDDEGCHKMRIFGNGVAEPEYAPEDKRLG
jgi:L-asparaginase